MRGRDDGTVDALAAPRAAAPVAPPVERGSGVSPAPCIGMESPETAVADPVQFPGRTGSPRSSLWRWAALTALVPVAFAVVVVALNAGVYSPGGFVTRYLDALARRDIAVALEMPGVEAPVGSSTQALRRDAMSGLGDHRIIADVDAGNDMRRVTAEYELGGALHRTEFLLRPAPPAFVLFQGWRFAESPVARLQVTVGADAGFRVNGFEVTDGRSITAGKRVADLAVLSPARVVLDEKSRYLTAEPVSVDVTDPARVAVGSVDPQANAAFVSAVQLEVNRFLDGCAAQPVLQPAGCPFRRPVDDRILQAPQWSIASYPKIRIQPGVGDDGTFAWFVAPTDGVAHIRVPVVSLFDGSRSDLDEDVPFRVQYAITIRSDGGLDIRAV